MPVIDKINKLLEEKGVLNEGKDASLPKYDMAYWDWKDAGGAADEIKKALKTFGLYVIQAPSVAGQDQIGIIITDKKIDAKTARKIEIDAGILPDED